jgi:AraC-like DNA-binding protein
MEVTTAPEVHMTMTPGRREGEMTVAEVALLWGYRSRSHAWDLIRNENVVPFRQDRNRIYVKRVDAEEYLATLPTSGRRPRKGHDDE